MRNINTICVCFAIDNNYAEHCAATIASILDHSDSWFHFYVLNSDICEKKKEHIRRMKRIKECEISFVDINESDFDQCCLPPNSHFSKAIFFRLKIPSLIPDIKKAIYLDSDIILNKDIKELWEISFEESYVLACRAMTSKKNCIRLGLHEKTAYINSGVLVLNLEKMRADDIEERFFNYIAGNQDILLNPDQDVINMVFSKIPNGIKNIDQNWNAEIRTDIALEDDYEKIVKNPYAIHFITGDKPWGNGAGQQYKEKYWKYRIMSMRQSSVKEKTGVIYTCITGGYDDLQNHSYIHPDWDYVCFTDSELRNTDLVWQVKPLVFDSLDEVRNARWHKLHPHILFPEYERSIWADANANILKNDFFDDINKAIVGKLKLSMTIHHARDCLYEESKACLDLGKDDASIMENQIYLIKKEGFPKNYGLFESNVIYREHQDEIVKKLMGDWWWWIENYSRRDQLSLTYVLWKNSCRASYLNDVSYRNSDSISFRDNERHVTKEELLLQRKHLHQEVEHLHQEVEHLHQEVDKITQELLHKEQKLQHISSSKLWKLRKKYLSLKKTILRR